MDYELPSNWTVSYVNKNKEICFNKLISGYERMAEVLYSGSNEDIVTVLHGLNEMISGLFTIGKAEILDTSGFICITFFQTGVIAINGLTEEDDNTIIECALAAFNDCRDWSKGDYKELSEAMIDMLEDEDCNLDEIRETVFSEYPKRVHDELLDLAKNLKEKKQQSSSGGGCYVATCVYGSYDCPQVWTLRRYRDNTLAKTWYGRAFIRTYYAISPTLVKWFGKTKWFKQMWQRKLDRMVNRLNCSGIPDTPYCDKY